MSPPEQKETTVLDNNVKEGEIDIKQLALEGYYFEFPEKKYPKLPVFEHKDVGHLADPKKASLFDNATKVFDLTPNIGTEIHGIQLNQLTDQQKNDLGLLIAERGVVFFRDQKINPYEGKELGSYYGPLHIHNVGGHPPGLEEVLPIYYETFIAASQQISTPRNSLTKEPLMVGWHSDVSYELQPPGFTFLKIDILPGESGGDTIWSSGYAAYDRLSPELQKRIEGLEAVHSGKEQAAGAAAFGHTVRREDVEHIHPLVRTHPVTKLKALYVQPGFTRRIVGLNKHESDSLLQLLYDHIAGGYDFHVRFKWTEDTVAVWDNRVTSHVAIFDYLDSSEQRRHGWRITTQAERPYFDPESKSQKQVREEKRKQASV
ncbi:tfdA family taurine dioxygenase [Mucor ambiguus]|uniref:TfdA family taurine dioxygenase n=1 Tax=Mucor ambiguus TaxID=91626 RepID=A0A0C9MR57_9FUNG|nr:tfdA family taurine dioxygenase [Mucor ambiguus]